MRPATLPLPQPFATFGRAWLRAPLWALKRTIAVVFAFGAQTLGAALHLQQELGDGGLDRGGAEVVAAALPPARRAPDRPRAVRAAFGSLFSYLASRPALARLLMVEAYVAGPEALERRDEALRPIAELLRGGYQRSAAAPRIAIEAICGGLYALAYRQTRERGAAGLPSLTPISTYIALAPFIGPEEACDAANSDGLPESAPLRSAARPR